MLSATYSLLMKNEKAHNEPVICCAWASANLSQHSKSNPRDIIATSGINPDIKIWEWENNMLKLKQPLKGHSVSVTSLSFSPDGQTLVSTAMDFTLIVWDLVTGNQVHRIPAPNIWRAVFGPDGLHVVAGCHNEDLHIYNIAKGKLECVFDTRERFALGVAWSANEKHIACGTLSGAVCVLDSVHGKVVHTFKDHRDAVKNIAFSPNSKHLVTASTDCSLKLYDVVAGSLLHTLNHTCAGTSVCFSPDGKRIALGTSEGEVLIASTDGLQVLKVFKEHSDYVWQVQFNPKGDLVMSTSTDKTINVYECPIITKK